MKSIKLLLLVLLISGCSGTPRTPYSPDQTKPLTQLKILPSSQQKAWATICHNGEWQSLHTHPISRGPFNFDASTFSKTIEEASAELPTNEPIILGYSFQWNTGAGANVAFHSCSEAFIVELKENHTYELDGDLVNQRKCKYNLIEIDGDGNERSVDLIRNFIPCNQHKSSADIYEINKAHALRQWQSKKK